MLLCHKQQAWSLSLLVLLLCISTLCHTLLGAVTNGSQTAGHNVPEEQTEPSNLAPQTSPNVQPGDLAAVDGSSSVAAFQDELCQGSVSKPVTGGSPSADQLASVKAASFQNPVPAGQKSGHGAKHEDAQPLTQPQGQQPVQHAPGSSIPQLNGGQPGGAEAQEPSTQIMSEPPPKACSPSQVPEVVEQHEPQSATPAPLSKADSPLPAAPCPTQDDVSHQFGDEEVEEGRKINLAAAVDGANVVAANKEAKKPDKAIDGDHDSFMKNPCSANKWMVVELSQLGRVDEVELTMKELYSSRVRDFTIRGRQSHPKKDGPDFQKSFESSDAWQLLGHFKAENKKGSQTFRMQHRLRVRYLLLQFHTHYGNEEICALNSVHAWGVTAAQELEAALARQLTEPEGVDHAPQGPGQLPTLSSAMFSGHTPPPLPPLAFDPDMGPPPPPKVAQVGSSAVAVASTPNCSTEAATATPVMGNNSSSSGNTTAAEGGGAGGSSRNSRGGNCTAVAIQPPGVGDGALCSNHSSNTSATAKPGTGGGSEGKAQSECKGSSSRTGGVRAGTADANVTAASSSSNTTSANTAFHASSTTAGDMAGANQCTAEVDKPGEAVASNVAAIGCSHANHSGGGGTGGSDPDSMSVDPGPPMDLDMGLLAGEHSPGGADVSDYSDLLVGLDAAVTADDLLGTDSGPPLAFHGQAGQNSSSSSSNPLASSGLPQPPANQSAPAVPAPTDACPEKARAQPDSATAPVLPPGPSSSGRLAPAPAAAPASSADPSAPGGPSSGGVGGPGGPSSPQPPHHAGTAPTAASGSAGVSSGPAAAATGSSTSASHGSSSSSSSSSSMTPPVPAPTPASGTLGLGPPAAPVPSAGPGSGSSGAPVLTNSLSQLMLEAYMLEAGSPSKPKQAGNLFEVFKQEFLVMKMNQTKVWRYIKQLVEVLNHNAGETHVEQRRLEGFISELQVALRNTAASLSDVATRQEQQAGDIVMLVEQLREELRSSRMRETALLLYCSAMLGVVVSVMLKDRQHTGLRRLVMVLSVVNGVVGVALNFMPVQRLVMMAVKGSALMLDKALQHVQQ